MRLYVGVNVLEHFGLDSPDIDCAALALRVAERVLNVEHDRPEIRLVQFLKRQPPKI